MNAEPRKVPVMTKIVKITSFHPILAKSFISFPNEIPANAPNAVVGAKNATFDVVLIIKSFIGEMGEANSSANRETYIIEGNFINWLINLLKVKPTSAIQLKTPIPIIEAPMGILYPKIFVNMMIVDTKNNNPIC